MYTRHFLKTVLTICLLPLIFLSRNSPKTFARSQSSSINSDFQAILNTLGLQVYQKNYDVSLNDRTIQRKDFVTIVDISKTSLINLTGNLVKDKDNEIKLRKKTLHQFWKDADTSFTSNRNISARKLQVVLNGTFFSTNQNPTGIAFGLQTNNQLITYGYGVGNEFPGQITTLAFSPSLGAKITPYNPQIFKLYPEVVGGLHPLANKSAKKHLPRTFAGVKDNNRDGVNETVIFYSSNYARQIDAIATLRKFGSHRNIMLDGGGSTGIIVNGKSLISTNRPIPHAIAIYQ